MSGWATIEAKRAYQREWYARRRAAFFADKSCVWPVDGGLCGSTVNLRLDHIDPAKKVSHRIWSWSAARRAAEIEKCQVLCHDHHVAKTLAGGEVPYGEANHHAKVTEQQVLEMRRLRAEGWTYTAIGEHFGMSRCVARSTIVRNWQRLATP